MFHFDYLTKLFGPTDTAALADFTKGVVSVAGRAALTEAFADLHAHATELVARAAGGDASAATQLLVAKVALAAADAAAPDLGLVAKAMKAQADAVSPAPASAPAAAAGGVDVTSPAFQAAVAAAVAAHFGK